jgi:two-component system sensor histidine kinase UhpB
MTVKTLRYQINTRILLLSVCVFAVGAVMTLWHAKRAVEQEMQSSIHLATQLITFELSQNHARTQWLAQLNALKETRHLHIQLKEPSGNILTVPIRQNLPTLETPPRWFVNLVAGQSVEIERTLSTTDGNALIMLIKANPLNEISEVWDESLAFFGLLCSLIFLVFVTIHVILSRVLKAISIIVQRLARVEQGDYQTQLPHFSSEDMNQIARAMNHLIEKLNASQQENRALTQHTLAIQEEERQRLAQELHDELGQSLTAIKVMTVTVAKLDNGANALIKQSTDHVVSICDHLMHVVRSMMQQLHPLVLTQLGLKAALDDLTTHWQKRYDLHILFRCHCDIALLPETMCIHIFRMVQEGLTNVVRHANASSVTIDLSIDDNHQLHLIMCDNGQGCDAQHIQKGFGLLSMRERVRSLQGEFHIQTQPQQGMAIHIHIPL